MLDIGTRSEELTVGVWFRFYKVSSQFYRWVISNGRLSAVIQSTYRSGGVAYTASCIHVWHYVSDGMRIWTSYIRYFNMKRLGRAPPDAKDITTTAATSCCSISSSLQFVPDTQFGINEASQLRSAGGSHPGLSLRIDSPEYDVTLRRRE